MEGARTVERLVVERRRRRVSGADLQAARVGLVELVVQVAEGHPQHRRLLLARPRSGDDASGDVAVRVLLQPVAADHHVARDAEELEVVGEVTHGRGPPGRKDNLQRGRATLRVDAHRDERGRGDLGLLGRTCIASEARQLERLRHVIGRVGELLVVAHLNALALSGRYELCLAVLSHDVEVCVVRTRVRQFSRRNGKTNHCVGERA
jgi:hypothetical protein